MHNPYFVFYRRAFLETNNNILINDQGHSNDKLSLTQHNITLENLYKYCDTRVYMTCL